MIAFPVTSNAVSETAGSTGEDPAANGWRVGWPSRLPCQAEHGAGGLTGPVRQVDRLVVVWFRCVELRPDNRVIAQSELLKASVCAAWQDRFVSGGRHVQ